MIRRDRTMSPETKKVTMAEQQAADVASHLGRGGAVRTDVVTAVALGWHMAEFLDEVPDRETRSRPGNPGGALPGLSRLTAAQYRQLRCEQIQAGLHRLQPALDAAGATDGLSDQAHAVLGGRSDLEADIRRLHAGLLIALTAADPVVGKAYGLGRAVADLSLRPAAPNGDDLLPHMQVGRLTTIRNWLCDLQTALPDHAARAVLGTLDQWHAWRRRPTIGRRPATAADHNAALDALRAQAKVWRSLLTGERKAVDLLDADNYIEAGNALIARYRRLGLGFLRRYLPYLVAVLVAAGAAISIAVKYSEGTPRAISIVTAVGAALGITGKTATAAVGRAASGLRDSLWGAELDVAIGLAATRLPHGRKAARLTSRKAHRLAQERAKSILVDLTAAEAAAGRQARTARAHGPSDTQETGDRTTPVGAAPPRV